MSTEAPRVPERRKQNRTRTAGIGAVVVLAAGGSLWLANRTSHSETTPPNSTAETGSITTQQQFALDALAANRASKLIRTKPGAAHTDDKNLTVQADSPAGRHVVGRKFNSYTIRFLGKPATGSAADTAAFLATNPHVSSIRLDQSGAGTASFSVQNPNEPQHAITAIMPNYLLRPSAHGFVDFGAETPYERAVAIASGSLDDNTMGGVVQVPGEPLQGREDAPRS